VTVAIGPTGGAGLSAADVAAGTVPGRRRLPLGSQSHRAGFPRRGRSPDTFISLSGAEGIATSGRQRPRPAWFVACPSSSLAPRAAAASTQLPRRQRSVSRCEARVALRAQRGSLPIADEMLASRCEHASALVFPVRRSSRITWSRSRHLAGSGPAGGGGGAQG
jgi:hypothetical protein